MAGDIEIFIKDSGEIEVDMSKSGLSADLKRTLREEIADGVGGEVTQERHAPKKVKERIRLKGG